MPDEKHISKRGGLEGNIFHFLTVIKDIGRTDNGTIIYECLCKCGKRTQVNSNSLRQGVIKSCGCYKKEIVSKLFKTHGLRRMRIYKIWSGIIQRCDNAKNTSYERYGGNGIKVCDEWYDFMNFYTDMKDGYADNLTIERVNSSGNYERSNCRWATYKEQSDNRSTTIYLNIDGETKKLMEWSRISGTNPNIIRQRIKRYQWSHKEAVYGKQF